MPTQVIQEIKYAVFVNDVQVMVTGDVSITEDMGNLVRVAEFELAEQPEAYEPDDLVDNDVKIYWLDYDSMTSYVAFSGRVNAVEVESEPWSFLVRSTDQLELLRRVPTFDHNLTGMTDGEAVEAILTDCGVDFDSADIADAGYELGAQIPIKWLKNTPGADFISEINNVFGSILTTIGDNRVVRFFPDYPPVDATGKYRDFEKGVDADWSAHRRQYGDRDSIQNFWQVTGASWDCGPDDECTCQPWANAIDGNAQLGGRRIRTTPGSVSSDLIQDEALAEYVARRQMRLFNRFPDIATVEAINDPNVHPGTKIGLIDHTFGINTHALRLGTVSSANHTGAGMSLTVICGDPGEEGTVTHGVEKVCNDTHTDVDVPGDFDPPDFDVPDIDTGLDFDIPDFNFDFPILVIGGTEDPEPPVEGELIGADLDLWIEVYPVLGKSPGLLYTDEFGGGYHSSREIDPNVDWQISAVMQFEGDPTDCHIGICRVVGPGPISLVGVRELLITQPNEWYVQTNDGYAYDTFSEPFDSGVDILVDLVWNQATQTLSGTLTQGDHIEFLDCPDTTTPDATTYGPFILTSASTGGGNSFTSFVVTGGE